MEYLRSQVCHRFKHLRVRLIFPRGAAYIHGCGYTNANINKLIKVKATLYDSARPLSYTIVLNNQPQIIVKNEQLAKRNCCIFNLWAKS